jgi:hypothetical protein
MEHSGNSGGDEQIGPWGAERSRGATLQPLTSTLAPCRTSRSATWRVA